jgi:hypothetical protein
MAESFDTLKELNDQIATLTSLRYESDRVTFLDDLDEIVDALITIKDQVNAVKFPAFLPNEFIQAKQRQLREHSNSDILRIEESVEYAHLT